MSIISIINGTVKDENDDIVATEFLNGVVYFGLKGDVNTDGQVDIIDALLSVNILLEIITPTTFVSWAADCNSDGQINILDVIGIVNVVLGIKTCVL